MTSKRLLTLGFIGLFLFAGFILFYKLGTEPFQDYDEATYAEVTSESLSHGNYVSLTYQNQPYFRKPPLLFWLTTTSQRFIPDDEFATRFPSELAALGAIVLVILICLEAGALVPFALLAGVVLATSASFMEFARDVRFDILVTFFITLAFYAGIRAVKDRRWYVLTGAALGLAFLSKNVIVAFAGVALLSFTLMELGVSRFIALLKDRYLWSGVAAFFLVAAPWHLIQTLRFGTAFWHSYLGTEVFERASVNLFAGGNNPTNAQYAVHLLRFAAPWTELFLASLLLIPFLYRKAPARVRSVLVAAAVTAVSVLIVMGTAQTKAYGYLMPLYPFLAVTIALTLSQVWARVGETIRMVLLGMLIVAVSYGGYLTYYDALHVNPFYGWELGHAVEERDIAALIRESEDPVVYAHEYYHLGSIIYYARLPYADEPFVLLLSSTSTPPTGSFVLANESLSELQAAFPKFSFTETYAGRFVSLFTIAD